MFTTLHTPTQTLQHTIRLIITITQTIQTDMVTLRESTYNSMPNSMFKSTLLMLRAIITLPHTITAPPIIMVPVIIFRLHIIITMDIFITLIMMAHTEERITGTPTGGMLTSS